VRTFIAVNLTEAIRSEIGGHLDAFRSLARGITWVPPENAHITMKFLGEVPESELGGVTDAVKNALWGHKPFQVQLGGFGAFPNFKRPRVFWVGITDGVKMLRDLAGFIENQLVPLGFEKEKRKFSAHITLGRVKRPGDFKELWHAADNTRYLSEPFVVPSVEVMKSVLTPQGAKYSVFESFSLHA